MSNVRVDSLGFIKKPDDYNYLRVDWERGRNLINITLEGVNASFNVEDIEWLRSVLFQIDYELKKEE